VFQNSVLLDLVQLEKFSRCPKRYGRVPEAVKAGAVYAAPVKEKIVQERSSRGGDEIHSLPVCHEKRGNGDVQAMQEARPAVVPERSESLEFPVLHYLPNAGMFTHLTGRPCPKGRIARVQKGPS
jgi:hypothetical protein